MRIRCSKGLRIAAFFGHFFIRSTDLLALPACDADKVRRGRGGAGGVGSGRSEARGLQGCRTAQEAGGHGTRGRRCHTTLRPCLHLFAQLPAASCPPPPSPAPYPVLLCGDQSRGDAADGAGGLPTGRPALHQLCGGAPHPRAHRGAARRVWCAAPARAGSLGPAVGLLQALAAGRPLLKPKLAHLETTASQPAPTTHPLTVTPHRAD